MVANICQAKITKAHVLILNFPFFQDYLGWIIDVPSTFIS